ncbi:hypothetical protein ACFWUQ_00920 [Streptomyces sp. NPDC058662]|uniref:hypothetical protein n=1 Tax=Streptomyces sp. NPDC058662 TaxID=3346583 RepID=UPI00364CECDB
MTTGPRSAEPTPATDGSGAPKVVAEGVLPALRSDPSRDDGRRFVAWLHITAPGRGATPSVRSWCVCGRNLFAAGQRRALALIADHAAHRDVCPSRDQERKAAA